MPNGESARGRLTSASKRRKPRWSGLPRWSNRAAASPTLRVRCWRRKTATGAAHLPAVTPIFPWKSQPMSFNVLGERAYLFCRAVLISDEGLLVAPAGPITDGFFRERSAPFGMTPPVDRTRGRGSYPQAAMESHDKILIVDFRLAGDPTHRPARAPKRKIYPRYVPIPKAESAFRELRPKRRPCSLRRTRVRAG